MSPEFVGQPTGNGSAFSQSELDNFNFTPASGSPLVGHGVKNAGAPALDYSGKNRPNPLSIGALE